MQVPKTQSALRLLDTDLTYLWFLCLPNPSKNIFIMDILNVCIHMHVCTDSELETHSRYCFTSPNRQFRAAKLPLKNLAKCQHISSKMQM